MAGYKFMDEMHLREPGFIYSACGQFTKAKNTAFKRKQMIHNIFIKTN